MIVNVIMTKAPFNGLIEINIFDFDFIQKEYLDYINIIISWYILDKNLSKCLTRLA